MDVDVVSNGGTSEEKEPSGGHQEKNANSLNLVEDKELSLEVRNLNTCQDERDHLEKSNQNLEQEKPKMKEDMILEKEQISSESLSRKLNGEGELEEIRTENKAREEDAPVEFETPPETINGDIHLQPDGDESITKRPDKIQEKEKEISDETIIKAMDGENETETVKLVESKELSVESIISPDPIHKNENVSGKDDGKLVDKGGEEEEDMLICPGHGEDKDTRLDKDLDSNKMEIDEKVPTKDGDVFVCSDSNPISSSKSAEESQSDDEDIAVIRIRDIGSLREDDSDDDVIEVIRSSGDVPQKILPPLQPVIAPAKAHSPYVTMDENNDSCSVFVPISMSCGTDDGDKANYKEQQRKSLLLRRKLVELSSMLKDMQSRGQSGINVRHADKLKTVSSENTSSLQVNSNSVIRLRAPGTTGVAAPTTGPSGFARLNCVVTPRGIQQVPVTNTAYRPITSTRPHVLNPGTPSGQQLRLSSSTTTTNMHQVVFDPNSGLLLCPTTQTSASAVTAPNQGANLQHYRAMQATPQFLAALRSGSVNRPVMVNGTSITRVTQQNAVLGGSTNVASSSNVDRNPSVQMPPGFGYRQRLPKVMTPAPQMKTYQNILPKTQGALSSTIGQVASVVVRQSLPSSSSSGGSLNSIRNQAPYQSRPTTSLSISKPKQIHQPPATAPPASASFIRKPAPAKPNETNTVAESVVNSVSNQMNNAAAAPSDKTFPSLVVVVKPYLHEKLSKLQTSSLRADLDSKVKAILMQSPAKFTEWLIQKGLLKMDNKCCMHNTPYKLGLYSDSDKYPFSGGYVFTVDCCPEKQLPVFQGSIFEGLVHPPGTTVKLMYHWACQTPAPNVLQWVKVTNQYLKNFYTLLRSVCVAALHENASTMGGRGKYIEVGVVTLGSGTVPVTKIEILGVFDPAAKLIRMRLLNSTTGFSGEQAKRERIDQILTPISKWVNRDSVLLVDFSLDKAMVEKLGFRNVKQSKTPVGAPVKTTIPTNINVMNYLQNIVPKMFQNTLCVLSRSLIQQFLDELSWRELWGSHSLKAFDVLFDHLVAMTKADTGDLLIPRLNKISLNPFLEWSYSTKTLPPPSGIECLPDSIRSQPLSELVASAVGMDSTISNLVSTYLNNTNLSSQSVTSSISTAGNSNVAISDIKSTANRTGKRKADEDINSLDFQKLLAENPKTFTLQTYYYIYCPASLDKYKIEFSSNLKCPLCSKVLKTNTETISHLITHVLSIGRLSQNHHGCRYCFKEYSTVALLEQHVNYAHKKLNETNVCGICLEKCPSEALLIFHMWKRHVNCEAPYRCEVCEYRTSFHYDVVDHFYKEHGNSDTVQCPICLKTFAVRSISCLKHVVTHLQNHALKKGKKCPDCCLSFSTDIEFRSHLLNDAAHDCRQNKNYVQHEVEGDPIRMPKPPLVNKDLNIPPQKKNKTRSSGSNQSHLQTLNSTFSVPLNPNDRYMFTPMKIKISDAEMFAGMTCWECFKPITLAGHYVGTMKCSRCRFETCCNATILTHIKSHDASNVNETTVRKKLTLSREADSYVLECSGCYFVSGSTRRFADHLLTTGHKTCSPKNCGLASGAAGVNVSPK